jgi:hypothetical protein
LSARLYTDTTTVDSAGNVTADVAVAVPGVVASSGIVSYGGIGLKGDPHLTRAYSTGWPFTGNPTSVYFYLKADHPVPDTAHYTFALTRWDSVAMKRDTLALNDQDIPDARLPDNQWTAYADSVHYLMAGVPDTVYFIFFGGRNADLSKVGNTTWLDDVGLSYDTITIPTLVGQINSGNEIQVYPNPASNLLTVRMEEASPGCNMLVYDATGRIILEVTIANSLSTISTEGFSSGNYFYRLLDKEQNEMSKGKFMVLH